MYSIMPCCYSSSRWRTHFIKTQQYIRYVRLQPNSTATPFTPEFLILFSISFILVCIAYHCSSGRYHWRELDPLLLCDQQQSSSMMDLELCALVSAFLGMD